MSYPAEVLADSPAMYLRLGEPSGTNANDETANGNDGTYVNAPTLGVAGAIDDGDTAVTLTLIQSEQITVADHATLDLGDVFTLECWVKVASFGFRRRIIDKGADAYCIEFQADDKLWLLREEVAYIVTSTVAISDSDWHHVVATKNGAAVKLYIDGVDRTGTVTDSTCGNNATDLRIGVKYDDAQFFYDGSLDEVAVYPTALSQARVQAHFDAATGLPSSPPTLRVVRSALRLA